MSDTKRSIEQVMFSTDNKVAVIIWKNKTIYVVEREKDGNWDKKQEPSHDHPHINPQFNPGIKCLITAPNKSTITVYTRQKDKWYITSHKYDAPLGSATPTQLTRQIQVSRCDDCATEAHIDLNTGLTLKDSQTKTILEISDR